MKLTASICRLQEYAPRPCFALRDVNKKGVKQELDFRNKKT